MQKQDQLLEQAKESPQSPGVYLMKDVNGKILYIGKAKNLKSRISSYFQAGADHSTRIQMLVELVDRFDVLITETESEALILECTLIKTHKPKFNLRLKDDKAYPYLKIQIQDDFPRIEWTRRVKKDGARYFGPFPSAWAARQVMKLLNETFRLRDCSENTFRHRSRPCILHQMDKCSGPCVALIDPRDYRETIDDTIGVLEGRDDQLMKSLQKGMDEASENMEYEEAALYRDQIYNLNLVTQTQGVSEAGTGRNRDVVGLSRRNEHAHGSVLNMRNGKLVAVRHFDLQNAEVDFTDQDMMLQFLAQYYVTLDKARQNAEKAGGTDQDNHISHARDVLLPFTPSEVDLLEKALDVDFKVSENKEDEQILAAAKANADHALELKIKKNTGHGIEALEEIYKKLHLDHLPERIECYDISNIQGTDAVASRVVFLKGAPNKDLYRRYKIKTVEGANDFAMMKEVLGRRFSRADDGFPDLVVVDGGKGQLAQAVAILDELNVQGVAVVGLAKARVERDFKAKEVASSMERIFIPNRKNPVPLKPHTKAYQLLTHIRDEAHRFAVNYHRKLRSKRNFDPK